MIRSANGFSDDSRFRTRENCDMLRGERFQMIRWIHLGAFVLTLFLGSRTESQETYDLVIRGGRLVDGTGNPWRYADLAIQGDHIVEVSHGIKGTGRREVDATGLIVAPGFIDIHSHSDFLLLEDGAALSKIFQGVTTEVLGEGSSVAPFRGTTRSDGISETKRFSSLDSYFRELESSGIAVNVATYVGMDNLWRSVMGSSFARPTTEQFEEMKQLLDEAMRDGAFGMSTMLAMPPGSLATIDDIVDLCGVVRRYGGIYSTHNRHEGTDVIAAVREAIEIGERASVPVDIIHLKIADQSLWGHMNELVQMINEARRRGVNVQANVYPYTRGNNNLSSIIPPWAHEGGLTDLVQRLREADTRQRMKKDILGGISGWYNHYTAVGGDWSRMLISGKGPYEGMTMDRIQSLKKKDNPNRDSLDVLFDLLIEQNGSIPTVYEHHTETDMNLAMLQPWCSIGSDGSAYAIQGPLRRGNPHPRNFGTFPRVLGLYVRENKLLQLEDAVRKMTSLNAVKLGIRDRGFLMPGMKADITVFSEEEIGDLSTYQDPFQYSRGVEWVLINGQIVLDQKRPTASRPGKALRHGR